MVGTFTLVGLITQTSFSIALSLSKIDFFQYGLLTIGNFTGLSLAFLILFYDIPYKIKRRIGLKT